MKRICTLLMVALAMLVTSCLRYDKDEGLHLVRTVQVSVSVDDIESAGTKSAVTAQDVSAENFNIWIYDANGLVYDGYFTDADNIKVDNLTVGTMYHVRAVANTGALVPPTTLDEADALAFDWDISGLNSSKGVPMTYKDSFTLSITSALDIHFRRAVAKYTFVIDQSGFTGTYTIRSLRLCNAPSKVLAFADSKIDGTTIAATDGDYATDADLTKLNQGLGVHFFIYENNQGEILSGNSDPWKKEFINYNTDKAAAASRCTYLEVTGDYVTTGITVEDLTYRIYLGKNSTTNFDVTRNTAYTVILAPQDAAALDDAFTSWKVERGTISDTRGLAFSPASVSVPSMGEASVTVVPTPSSLEYVLEAGENFTASGLTFEQTGNAVTIKSTSIVSAETQTKLVARTSDGSKSKNLPVTVLPPTVESVTVTPADGWEIAIGEDRQFTATVTMLDGSVQDITSSATWSTTTTTTLTKKATAGLFNAKAAGSAVVKAEYEGKSATSTGTVKEDVYSYRIVLSGGAVAVTKDKTAEVTPKVMYYVTKNGVEDSGTDVTANAVLKSKDTGIATVSGTTVTGVAVGNTRLYAEYSNGSQTVSSDRTVGGSYIDVTVSDKSVEGYEYNDPIFELSYNDVGANGSAATPTLTYSQTATRLWSDGTRDENVVIAAAGSAIPSGVTVTWGGSAKNSSEGSIDSETGNVSAKNRGTNDYSRGVVFTATASATINGKPGSISKDVYQAGNEVVSTVQADSKTVNSDWSVDTYQDKGFSNVSSSGGTASFETYVYHTATVYKKYTRTWSSGSSATSDWEYVSQSKAYDDVTISSNQSWARVNRSSAGGAFEAVAITVDPNGSAARTATITIRNSNGNQTTRTISQLAGLYLVSYGTPTVTLSYPNTSIAYTRKSPLSPTLTVTQVYNYSDGSSPVVTLSSSDYTVSYSGSASGFSLDPSSGVITPTSNAGVTTPGGITFGEIENLKFSYENIPVGGGSSSPEISYSQTKTETTDGRTSTSSRSITVTATVQANGKSGSDSETITQKGDPGQESTTTTSTITSGGSITYSGSATGLSLSGGTVSALSNVGSGGGVSYGDVAVSFTAPKTTFSNGGETITCNTPTYSQTKTTAARNSTSSRSIAVKATVKLNNKTASKEATCTQDGDPGTAASSETITDGGTITYGFTRHDSGFSYSGNKVTASSNKGSTIRTSYDSPVITKFEYPASAPYGGGTISPTIECKQSKYTNGRKAKDPRSCVFTATVAMKGGKSGSASIDFTQEGDSGDKGTETVETVSLYASKMKFSFKTSNSGASFSSTAVNEGKIKWTENSETSGRSVEVQLTVTSQDLTSEPAVATARQDAKPVSYSISVDSKSLTFDCDASGSGSKKTVTVTCPEGDWEVSSTPSGWTATKNGGNIEIYPNAANASTTSEKKGTVTVHCKGDYSKTADITVTQGKNYITKTTQKTQSEQAEPLVTDTEHWVKINGKTSDSKEVSADAGSVTVTVTAGHTHTVQPRIKTRTYDEYTWAVGPNTTGNYSEWTEENHGDPTVTHPSNDTPDLTSSASWLQTDGSYSVNGSTESTRSATITATNNGASATLKVTQAKADSYSIEIK